MKPVLKKFDMNAFLCDEDIDRALAKAEEFCLTESPSESGCFLCGTLTEHKQFCVAVGQALKLCFEYQFAPFFLCFLCDHCIATPDLKKNVLRAWCKDMLAIRGNH